MHKMVRLALAGLALAAPFASALDDAVLVQISKENFDVEASFNVSSAFEMQTLYEMESALELLGHGADGPGYAFEEFDEGLIVEGKTLKGSWVPCLVKKLHMPERAWDVHVIDKVPGYDLPGVPAHLLRKRLAAQESDWHVDNGELQRNSFGLAYRNSKNLNDKQKTSYAPFDSLVVGSDEGDGWLKVSQGYLPMKVDDKTVLSERPRKERPAPFSVEARDWYIKEEEQRRLAAYAKEAKKPLPPQQYAKNEQVGFRNEHGGWATAQVLGHGLLPNTYNLLVGPSNSQRYLQFTVPYFRMQKTGPPAHTPVEGEPKICQKQGCIVLKLRMESGKEYKVKAVQGLRIAILMRAACARLGEAWESCQTRISLSHDGRTLSPSWRTYEAGLTKDSVVDAKLAPETATPIWDLSV